MRFRALIVSGLLGLAPHAMSLGQDPYPSTYRPADEPPTLIRGATLLTGTGARIDDGDILILQGRIEAVGPRLLAPPGARVVEAKGRWVTPGLIDVHSHLGLNASPAVRAHVDGNESTDPATANVWAEHSVLPQDPGFEAALAGGVTTLQVLPGSANLIGGRSVVLKNVRAATYQAMKFPDAPQGLKLACGENPKRVYGEQKGEFPSTRMGNVAGLRARWAEARDYQRKWLAYGEKSGDPPERNLGLETLVAALEGRIAVHQHCYRADEMAIALDMAAEFGYRIAAFHHATEAYKVADLLAARGVCAAMWSDWWGFKMEAYDGIQENVAFVDAVPGGCAIVHSDSEEGIQRLNQEAAKAMVKGRRAGLDVRAEHAIAWITVNAAKALGILDRVGSLETGKMADVVVWSGDPFSVYARAEQVWIDGSLQYDRAAAPRRTDFLLGQPALADAAAVTADTVLIRDALVHTMTARGSLESTDILVQEGRVAAIGESLAAPAGAEIIEARGRPVTPGLFGGSTQLGLREIDFEPAAQDESLFAQGLQPEFDAALALNAASAALAVNAVEGVTFAQAAPVAAGSIIAGQGAVIFLDGRGPAQGRALFVNLGGDANVLAGGSRAAQFMLLRQALDEVRNPGELLPDDRRLLTPPGRRALKDFISGRAPTIFDVDRAADITNTIALIRGFGLRGVIFGGVEAWRVASELAAHDIPVVLDPFAALPASLDGTGTTLANAARLHRAGVRIAFSLRDEASAQNNARRLRQAAGNAVAHGLPFEAALAAITRVPAEILGVADSVGSLAPGRPADLVLWSGDPLEVTTVAERVFIAGRAHPMRSRQTELRDRYLPGRLREAPAPPVP